MKRFIVGALGMVAIAIGSTDAQAQQTVGVFSRDGTASLTIPTVLYLDATNLNVTFPAPDHSAFSAGRIASATQSKITHAGNVQHSVQIRSNADFMTSATTGSASEKSSSDLQWSAGGSTFIGLDQTARDVVTGAPAGFHADAASLGYRMLLNYATDKPDTYSLGFTLTIIAN